MPPAPPAAFPASPDAGGYSLAAEAQAASPSIKKYLIFFWAAVAFAVASAWVLELLMPLTREYVIERWIMLAFGGFLVVFLFFLNKATAQGTVDRIQ